MLSRCIPFVMVALLLSGCGKAESDDGAPQNGEIQRVLKTCKLDQPLSLRGKDFETAVEGLGFTDLHWNTALQTGDFEPGSAQPVVRLFAIDRSNYAGVRLETLPWQEGPRSRLGFANLYGTGISNLYGVRSVDNDYRFFVTRLLLEESPSTNERARIETKVILRGNELLSLQLTVPVRLQGFYLGRNETLCLKSASLL